MDREKEIWAKSLWVEKHHGENGWLYIAQQQDRLLAQGKDAGARLWAKVGVHFGEIVEFPDSSSALN